MGHFLSLGLIRPDETAFSVQDSDRLHCHCAMCHLAGLQLAFAQSIRECVHSNVSWTLKNMLAAHRVVYVVLESSVFYAVAGFC